MLILQPGDEEVVCEVSDKHTEMVSMVEGQPPKVEDTEQDVPDDGGNKGIRDAGSTADFRILFEIFET